MRAARQKTAIVSARNRTVNLAEIVLAGGAEPGAVVGFVTRAMRGNALALRTASMTTAHARTSLGLASGTMTPMYSMCLTRE